MSKYIIFVLFCGLFSFQNFAENRAGENDYEALDEIASAIANWWVKLPEPKPKSVSISSISHSKNLDNNFVSIAESVILSQIAEDKKTNAFKCFECKAPQAVLKGDHLIVTKGIPDLQTMIDIAKKLRIESFLIIEINKTALSLKAQVTLVQTATGKVLNAKSFSVSNTALFESNMMFLLGTGLQFEITPAVTRPDNFVPPIGIDFTWLEQVGKYSKVGLNLGTVLLGHTGTMAYLAPVVGWKIRFGRSAFSLLPSVEAGFGYRDATIGLTPGANMDLFLGRFFFVGAKILSFLPLHNNEVFKWSVYPGFHLGMALGR